MDQCPIFDPASQNSIAVFTNIQFSLSSKAGAEIKQRFGGIDWLRAQTVTVGSMLAVQQNVPGDENAKFYVYYLVVRRGSSAGVAESSNNRLTAMQQMVAHAVANGVSTIMISLEASHYLNTAFMNDIATAFQASGVTPEISNSTLRKSSC